MPIEFRQKFFCRIALGGNSYEMITYMTRNAVWNEIMKGKDSDGFAHLDTITPDGEHKITLDMEVRDFQSLMHMDFIANVPSQIARPNMRMT